MPEHLPPTGRLSLRTRDPAATGAALNLDLSAPLNRATEAGARATLRLSPDEWLVLLPESDIPALLAAAPPGTGLTDISHRQRALALTGPDAADRLNAHCALDLALPAFPIGMVTRTLLAKAEIILWRRGDDAWHIEVARSFTPYVEACLDGK